MPLYPAADAADATEGTDGAPDSVIGDVAGGATEHARGDLSAATAEPRTTTTEMIQGCDRARRLL